MTGFVVQGHIFGYLIVDTYVYYFLHLAELCHHLVII